MTACEGLSRFHRSRWSSNADLKREFRTEKTCAAHCTISCVHQISYLDYWRALQTRQTTPGAVERTAELVNI